MTVEEEKPQQPDIDLNLTPRGFSDLMRHIKEKGYEKLEVDKSDLESSVRIGKEFVYFVEDVLKKIGIQYDSVRKPITIDMDPKSSDMREVLKQAWDKRALAWGWVETPA